MKLPIYQSPICIDNNIKWYHVSNSTSHIIITQYNYNTTYES